MIIIKFFSDFLSEKELLKKILNEYDWSVDLNYNIKYKFTINNDYTHAIIFNTFMKNLNIPKKNIIGLAQEPNIFLNLNNNFLNYCEKNVNKYYIGNIIYNNNILKYPFIEQQSYLFSQLKFIKYKNKIFNKNKIINFVYSNKNNNNKKTLYNYRHILGNEIMKNNLNVDIYGSSTINLKKIYKNNNNIKYPFEWKDIDLIYSDYKFSIVIENSINPEYFTEKIIIPLLCGCIPIYIGCSNINKYFGKYVIHLNGNINNDINIIKDILDNPDKFYKEINRNEILDIIHLKNVIYDNFIL